MPFGLGWSEVLLVLAVALILLGHKLPLVARSMGQSLVEFRRGLSDIHDEAAQAAK